ncbi:hypothetical protein Aduo_017775 [Ancylostoma duodenale]
MRVLVKVVFLVFVPYSQTNVIHDGGTCGIDAIPYRISIDDKGSPKLSCLTPPCLLDDRENMRQEGHGERQPLVKCKSFKEVVCSGDLQWTGGLKEVNNGTHNVLNTVCCSYPGMSRSQLVRTIFLGQDDSYEGGFHEKPGHIGGFDLIKEVRKSVNGDNRIQYIVTVHRLPCVAVRMRSKDYNARTLNRNKRRLDETKNEHEYEYELEESDRQRRPYRGQAERQFRRNRRPGFRRRAMMRDYDDYYDYDYAVIVPRQMMSRRQQASNRLWPLARAHADGGIFQPNDVIPLKDEQDVVVSSGSANGDDFTQLAPPQQQVQVAQAVPLNSLADGPLPPPSLTYQQAQQSLPQYVPAYREPPAYSPAPYAQPQQPQYRQPQPPREYARAMQQPIQQAQPQQYYYTYPSYYTPQGGLNGIFETMQCFSGDMEVETPSGSKAIKDLEVGDMVLSIDESMVTFSPVIMFLHRLENEKAQFLEIQPESFKPLKLTENHLMYVTDCNPSESFRLVPAKEARVGQCVQVTESVTSLTPRRIISIKRVAGVGIYAPLTSTGDIMVNRFLVSCHSNLALKTLQQTFFSVYRGLSGLLRDYFPKKFHDDAHLPFGVHYLTTIVDLFLPSSFL